MEQITLDLSNVRTKEIEELLFYCKVAKVKMYSHDTEPRKLVLDTSRKLATCFMYFLRANNVQYQVAVKNPCLFELLTYCYPEMDEHHKVKTLALLPPKYKAILKLTGDV